MTMHAAKGLEFPLVFIAGLEEGIFPHSRARDSQSDLEEERRLLYVAITRAEKYLYLTHAIRRRVYGEEAPAEPSRFLNEFPTEQIEDISTGPSWLRFANKTATRENRNALRALTGDANYQIEYDDDYSPARKPGAAAKRSSNYSGRNYNNAESVREFFARQGRKVDAPEGSDESRRSSKGSSGFRANMRVRHAKYGQGLIIRVEGEGEDAKLTVNFPGYGTKKLMAKFAGLEKI
jgi:DNA helicase-2/ATP-dependent DNA helicase PcrA